MQTHGEREESRRLIDDATWDDLMYKIYARQAIEAGLRDSESGRTVDVKEVRAKLRLPQ
jgi:predicted transcriptional regulator